MTLFFKTALFLLLSVITATASCTNASSGLEQEFRSMYNLSFIMARQDLTVWQQAHPDDPLGPASEAASYLFDELNRTGSLEAELFVDNEHFDRRKTISPDGESKRLFEAAVARALELADRQLKGDPRSADAMLAKTLAFGLKADYAALIEKHNTQALTYIRQGREWAQRALAADPACYDAYLALGVENYLLGTKPALVRAFLWLQGAQVDREKGVRELQVTAEKGRLLQPFARILLAVAALRAQDFAKAHELLQGLKDEFPGNPLYARELAKLESRTGWD